MAQKKQSIQLELGINTRQILEQRFTADSDYEFGFHTSINYEFGKRATINRMTWGFSKNFPKTQEEISFNHLLFEYRYTQLRPLNPTHYLGFFVDNGNSLLFPRGRWSENNTISYALWASTGVAYHWKKSISFNTQTVLITLDAATSLFSYVVRPVQGYPYPENFLKDGIFNVERAGMAKYLLTSGKLRTINSFNNITTKASIAIPFGEKAHQVGINYAWRYFHIGNDRPIWATQHQLSIQTTINF